MFVQALSVGVDIFEKLATEDYYFVDKTNFIRDLLDYRGDVNLFTRPRLFGKTLNLSMLQYFFEDSRNDDGENRQSLFVQRVAYHADRGEVFVPYGEISCNQLVLKI